MPTAKKKKPGGGGKPSKKPAGSSWRTGTWIGLLVFVSVWMFVLGILVGRGTVSTRFAVKDAQEALYALAEKAAKKVEKPDPVQEIAPEMDPDPFDGLKKSGPGGPITDDRFSDQANRSKTGQSPKSAGKPSQRPKRPGQNIVPNEKSFSRPIPTRSVSPQSVRSATTPAPQPKRKVVVISYRTLQTASMQNLSEAKKMVARLQQKGYQAYVASAAVSGKGMRHRVRIGPYKNETDASSALKRLRKEGIHAIMLK